jgi:exopolyphosphatase/pppGpp-phosphohydrolase
MDDFRRLREQLSAASDASLFGRSAVKELLLNQSSIERKLMAATALDDTLKRVRDDQRLFTAAFGLRSQAILGAKKAQSEMFASALMNIGTAIQNSIGQVNVRPLAIDKLLDVQRMTVYEIS